MHCILQIIICTDMCLYSVLRGVGGIDIISVDIYNKVQHNLSPTNIVSTYMIYRIIFNDYILLGIVETSTFLNQISLACLYLSLGVCVSLNGFFITTKQDKLIENIVKESKKITRFGSLCIRFIKRSKNR